jgi:hypothetical protein
MRQQHLDNWIEIDQHIATCSTCQVKCREFQQSSGLILGWVQDKKQQFYPTITNTVMQKIALESKLSPQKRVIGHLRQAYKYPLLEAVIQRIMGQEEAQSKRQAKDDYVSPLSPLTDEPLPGPFAELQKRPLPGEAQRSGTGRSRRARSTNRPVIALIAVAAIITFLIIGAVASPRVIPTQGNHTKSHPEGTAVTVPIHNNTPTPTKQQTQSTQTNSVSDPTATVTGPQISLCSNSWQDKHDIIRICGSNFTSGGRVWLAAYDPNVNQTRTADSDGGVDFQFNVSGCKNIPNLIIVVDTSSQKVAVLSNITLSSCSSKHH